MAVPGNECILEEGLRKISEIAQEGDVFRDYLFIVKTDKAETHGLQIKQNGQTKYDDDRKDRFFIIFNYG